MASRLAPRTVHRKKPGTGIFFKTGCYLGSRSDAERAVDPPQRKLESAEVDEDDNGCFA
jgi:hypothetical protein